MCTNLAKVMFTNTPNRKQTFVLGSNELWAVTFQGLLFGTIAVGLDQLYLYTYSECSFLDIIIVEWLNGCEQIKLVRLKVFNVSTMSFVMIKF